MKNVRFLKTMTAGVALAITIYPQAFAGGSCGATDAACHWEYDSSSKTLTITGNGAMSDFSNTPRPWNSFVGEIKNVTIAEGISHIGYDAFWKASSLESIHIPDSVKTLGDYAFCRTTNLKEITFGENSQLESIGLGTFMHAANLKEIQLPASLKTVDTWAFGNGGLVLADLSKATNLESIGFAAFAGNNEGRTVILPDTDFEFGYTNYNGQIYDNNYVFANLSCDSNGNCTTQNSSSLTSIYCAGDDPSSCHQEDLAKSFYNKDILKYEIEGDKIVFYDKDNNITKMYSRDLRYEYDADGKIAYMYDTSRSMQEYYTHADNGTISTYNKDNKLTGLKGRTLSVGEVAELIGKGKGKFTIKLVIK